jgi:GT2 family glycosyltransferase
MTIRPVTVVIPLHNDQPTVVACVRAVLARTDHPDWKLLVVDDGSTDGGPEALRAAFPQVQIIRQNRAGVSRALNTAITRPDHAGRDIVRLHADVVVETPGWLHQLSSAAHEGPGAAVVGARLLFPDGRIQSEGRSFITGLGMHLQHRDRRAFTPEGAAGPVTEVDSVSGALAYYRRDAFDQIGRLDENYGCCWMEDDDYCVAVRHLGHRVCVHPGVQGVHYTRTLAPGFQPHVQGSGPELKQVSYLLKDAATHLQAEYWQSKWGWDPYHPDLGEIRRLHGHTAICWQIGERLAYRPTDPTPTVDCCLVTWNTLPLLKRCLESLAATDYPADRIQVYIADNGSTDGTLAYLDGLADSYPFPIHVVKLAVNTGAPIGFNFAVAAGTGELVARLDDDIILPRDWLRPLVADLHLRPYAGCVGPKIINDNPTRTVQCGPYRNFPAIFGHDDEPDLGQADYLSRTTHVRGCCNLYRRDVFKRCGLFDPRFSPSQFDDPDHHLALIQAGYEVLYDGRVSVVHKLNNGLARSMAGLSNQLGNASKMFGKWGNDVFEVLERSLDLSREGRFLPDDGDTSAWLSRTPPAASFPRRVAGRPKQLGMIQRIYDELVKASASPSLIEIRQQLIELAAIKQRIGLPG